MSRTARAAKGGLIYHVYNRGNGRLRIFNRPEDYALFIDLLREGQTRAEARLLGFCLMPTHWHLLVWPKGDRDLAAFVGWVSNTHVRRWHQMHATAGGGHLYQGRYRSFPVQADTHVADLLQFMEANPLRAGIVEDLSAWGYSSMHVRKLGHAGNSICPLHSWVLPQYDEWQIKLNKPQPKELVEQIRTSIKRERPFGDDAWVKKIAAELNLQRTLRDPWRPTRREFA